ncbi:MAG TPA: spore coat protein [Pseudogracilibacillus sp.]|nr:spore coat protein [Pseudogracilibacillus sp.]
MFNQNNQQSQQQPSSQMPPQQQFGGHELLDVHQALGEVTGTLDHFVVYEQHVQDQELTNIMQRQKTFISQLYNTILDTLKSGKDPAVKTQTYHMEENNQSSYGMSPSSPKTPIQSVNELNDECISSGVMSHLKSMASSFTMTALEATNPVLRRIFADSVPNIIEMAFEMYLYQNKNQYYQVPQLSQQDMQALINSHGPIQGNMSH